MDRPLSLISLENDIKRMDRMILEKDALVNEQNSTIARLHKELEIKEEQMNKLIKKNVELSLYKLGIERENKSKKYVGYMTLD